jgi:hypothetical protein
MIMSLPSEPFVDIAAPTATEDNGAKTAAVLTAELVPAADELDAADVLDAAELGPAAEDAAVVDDCAPGEAALLQAASTSVDVPAAPTARTVRRLTPSTLSWWMLSGRLTKNLRSIADGCSYSYESA